MLSSAKQVAMLEAIKEVYWLDSQLVWDEIIPLVPKYNEEKSPSIAKWVRNCARNMESAIKRKAANRRRNEAAAAQELATLQMLTIEPTDPANGEFDIGQPAPPEEDFDPDLKASKNKAAQVISTLTERQKRYFFKVVQETKKIPDKFLGQLVRAGVNPFHLIPKEI